MAGWHGAGDALESGAISFQMMEVGGEDREAIAGGDKKMITHDHVAIAITIGGGSECRCAGLIHPLGEGMSMNQVRVRMAATKVFKRYGIHDRADGGDGHRDR